MGSSGRGTAQDDDVSDPECPDAPSAGLQTELRAVVRSQRPQGLRIGRDPVLSLVDHHAAGHARPHLQDHLATDSKLRAGPVILEEPRLDAGVDDDVGAEPTMIDSSADQALDSSERRRRQQMERRLIVVLDRALRQQLKSLSKGCGGGQSQRAGSSGSHDVTRGTGSR